MMSQRILTVLLVLVLTNSVTAKGTDPARLLPSDTLLYLDVDLDAAKSALLTSPLGKVIQHPDVIRALGQLPELAMTELERELAWLKPVTGVKLSELPRVASGRWILSFSANMAEGNPRIVLLAEVPEDHPVSKLVDSALKEGVNSESLKNARVDGGTTHFDGPGGIAVEKGRIDEFLVLTVGVSINAMKGRVDAKGSRLIDNPRFQTAKAGFDDSTFLSVFADVTGLMEKIKGSPLAAFAELPGFDALEMMAFSNFVENESLASYTEIRFAREPKGLLAEALRLLGPPGPEVVKRLERVPASAHRVGGFSVDIGRAVKGLLELINELTAGDQLQKDLAQSWKAAAESQLGISLERLSELPRIDALAFEVVPPSGSVLRDRLAIVSSDAAKAYLGTLGELARSQGGKVFAVELGGRDIAVVRLAWNPAKLLASFFGDGEAMSPAFYALIPWPALTVCASPLEDGTLIVGDTPQAVARYFSHYAQGESLGLSAIEAWLGEEQKGSGAWFVFRGEGSLFSAYNAVLELARFLVPFVSIGKAELRLEFLPSGEELAELFDGKGRVSYSSDGKVWRVRERHLLSHLIESIVSDFISMAATVQLR